MIQVLLITQAGPKPPFIQKRPAPEKKEMALKKTPVAALKTEGNTQTVAKESAPESGTPSWASDHNYNAVKPERTPAISSSLLFKCMYLTGIFLCSRLLFPWSPFPLFDSAKLEGAFNYSLTSTPSSEIAHIPLQSFEAHTSYWQLGFDPQVLYADDFYRCIRAG